MMRVLDDLTGCCRALKERLDGLRVTLVEDRPQGVDLALFTHRGEALDDLSASAVEAGNAVAQARMAESGGELLNVRRGICACHEILLAIASAYETELAGFERVADVMALARSQGGEWTSWSQAVRDALGDCWRVIHATNRSVFECWKEWGEQLAFSFDRTVPRRGGHLETNEATK
jgi:hypothetical protein